MFNVLKHILDLKQKQFNHNYRRSIFINSTEPEELEAPVHIWAIKD